jgi:hypothetical protein
MPEGVWVWPSEPKGQRSVLRKVAASPHLVGALSALAKSKDGLSNAELDDAINSSSEWTTLWVIRQLTSLGFIEFKVDFFGNPNKYELTDRGRTALSAITGKPEVKPPSNPPATITKVSSTVQTATAQAVPPPPRPPPASA